MPRLPAGFVLTASALVLCACSSAATPVDHPSAPRVTTPPAAPSATGAPEDTSDARVALMDRCAPCHLGGDPGQKPAALAVFDLAEHAFAAKMTDSQVKKLSARLGQFGETRESTVTAVRAFVDAELARRARSTPR